ncbi:MAG: ATP-dependent DNA helicase RecG [Bacteroidales bacterium]|jgi:ATP-dependent DNA helicase RecG|nr:ATP-dependent DNA helicase RecG [Bacteroidales bacterium]MDD3161770.1 ATP-dependent DNA helicase RecG [Bacteroidales bacterium]
MADLSKLDIMYVPGIGPKRAEMIKKELEVYTAEQLLNYFPYKHVDRSRVYYIHEIDGNMPFIQIKGKIVSFAEQGEGRSRRLTANFTDGTGFVELVWFQKINYIRTAYKLNTEYLIFGRPSLFAHNISIVHPEVDVYNPELLTMQGLQPYYNTTEKMKRSYLNSRFIQNAIAALLQLYPETLPETLPLWLVREEKMMSKDEAIRAMHFPQNPDQLRKAEYRIKYEELFYIQLQIVRYSFSRKRTVKGFLFPVIGDVFNRFYADNLPFPLTEAQKRVLREIRADVVTGKQMNRLLQGDVGSGKTLVALMSMLMAIDNGFQGCIMAPTEILATQHLETISQFIDGLGLKVELLTGSIRSSKRVKLLKELREGDIHILIGTHALIEDPVVFHNLGLVVIDEQHRFGVEQRSKLWLKNNCPPHILVMTATPIPRTLAMTLYGDLDVSVIDELPPGRKPILTLHHYDNHRASLYASVRKQIQSGRQVYIVYPLIKENEKMDYKNLEEGYEHIKEVFPEFNVCMVHGKMKNAYKEAAMQEFVSGKANIMVATTVIEVGVNVPNASVMIIESAERFGLAQLHQLRGRVGRGADQSYCILLTSFKLSETTRQRIDLMTRTNDGFEIAEADLRLRGPGDMEGTQQSGIAFDLKVASLTRDSDLLEYVRNKAIAIIEEDPDLSFMKNEMMAWQLKRLSRDKIEWGFIS